MRNTIFCAIAILSLSSITAISAEKHEDWMTKKEDGRCTAWTLPENGNDNGRYASIMNVPAEGVKNSVALSFGKKGAGKTKATANVDGQSFELLTYDQAAFAASGKPEGKLIRAMKYGGEMKVKWVEADGTLTQDTYSLMGFTAAKNKIDADCR